MDMLCPECMGEVATQDGKLGRCTVHGGRYHILFTRWRPAASRNPPAPQDETSPLTDLSVPATMGTGCPYCGQEYDVENQYKGQTVRCSSCNADFIVESAGAVGTPATASRAYAENGTPSQVSPPPASSVADALDPEVMRRVAELSTSDLQAMLSKRNEYREEVVAFAREVLFSRTGHEMCRRHPAMPAQTACFRCRAPVCGTCAFPQADGTSLCPDCAGSSQGAAEAEPVIPSGLTCARHPALPAVRQCHVCRAGICSTCDFAFPGNIHVCPSCVTKSEHSLSARRRKSLVWSYVLAVWTTIWIALLLSGVFAAAVSNQAELQALGLVFALLVLVPAAGGTALSIGTLDRRLSNPAVVWISAVWNVVLLAVFLLLCLIGNLME